MRSLGGVCVALLACVLAAPSKAQAAGCNAHVGSGGAQHRLAHTLDPLILGHADEPAQPAVPVAPRPCSGPSCSGKSTPPAAPVVTVTWHAEAWAWLGPGVPLPQLDSAFSTAPTSDLHPVVAPAAIFHPPRRPAPR